MMEISLDLSPDRVIEMCGQTSRNCIDELLSQIHRYITVDEYIYQNYTEPQIIAHMLSEWYSSMSPASPSDWSYRLGNISITVGAAFAHQKPRVKWRTMNKNCSIRDRKEYIELGDLLLVNALKSSTDRENIRYYAMLLQAKKLKDETTSIKLPQFCQQQYDLYHLWPKFDYYKTAGLTGSRRVTGLDMYNAAKYLVIGQGVSVTACPTDPASHIAQFDYELLMLLLGMAGKKFTLDDECTNGWSQVIRDIILNTHGCPIKNKGDGFRTINVRDIVAVISKDTSYSVLCSPYCENGSNISTENFVRGATESPIYTVMFETTISGL